jgi:hypothetical protein
MRIYQIWLADTLIGTTILEKADPPMGVVFGQIVPVINDFGYDCIKQMCKIRNIELAYDVPDNKLLATYSTKLLSVLTPEGMMIKCLNNQITGMDSDRFEIVLVGVPYPFYAVEFSKHCADYADSHKK